VPTVLRLVRTGFVWSIAIAGARRRAVRPRRHAVKNGAHRLKVST